MGASDSIRIKSTTWRAAATAGLTANIELRERGARQTPQSVAIKGNDDPSTSGLLRRSECRKHHALTVLLQLPAAASADAYCVHEFVAVEHPQNIIVKICAGRMKTHESNELEHAQAQRL